MLGVKLQALVYDILPSTTAVFSDAIGSRNTHLRKQAVLSRIFKRMVPVDYSYQSKKKYQEPFLLLVQ